jgi:hypothetical protein
MDVAPTATWFDPDGGILQFIRKQAQITISPLVWEVGRLALY